MTTIDIIMGLAGIANLYFLNMVRLQVALLEVRLSDKFISKNDFKQWTRQSTYLPDFEPRQKHTLPINGVDNA